MFPDTLSNLPYVFTLNCAGKAVDLTSPQVMGIINLSSESFCPKGRITDLSKIRETALEMVAAGAAIIDVGAEPTNPVVNPIVPLDKELDTIIPVIEMLAHECPIPISIDTSKPKVMQAAIEAGVGFINDVRALREPGAMDVVAKAKIPVCLMHMAYPDGTPTVLNGEIAGSEYLLMIKEFLQQRIDEAISAGIDSMNIIIDPGFGYGYFGKTTRQNCYLLQHLYEFLDLGFPLLVGLSYKTFIGDILAAEVEQRQAGSLACAVMAAERGAHIIRVHDVKETVDAINMVKWAVQSI